MPVFQNHLLRSIAILSLAILFLHDAEAGELLTNPGFESSTSGWVGRNCSIAAETIEVHSGAGAVRVYNRDKEWHSVRQDIRTVLLANGPGDYTVMAWVRAETGFSGTAKIKLVIVDSGVTTALNTSAGVSDSGWTEISTTRSISWTGTLDAAYFEVPHNTPTASYFVDDCSLEPIGPNEWPLFFSDPLLEANAAQDTTYVATLIDDAYDPNGDALTFVKTSGPAWLTVAPNGALSGTPAAGDVGLNAFAVEASDGGGTNAQTTLHINVVPPPVPIPLPYTDSFETRTRWAPVRPLDGWKAAPVVVAHQSSYPPAGFPFAVPHDQVLDVYSSTHPVFEQPAVTAQILLDTLIQPTFRTDPAPPATNPETQAAFFVNDDGYLVVRHKVFGNNFTTASETWSALSHTPLATGQWTRLTVRVDYQSDTLRNHSYYSVSLDNVLLSHPSAYTTQSPTNETTDMSGPWFLCANSGPGTGLLSFSGLGVDGISRLDDMALSDPTQRTARGTPFAWIDEHYLPGNYELLDQSDSDGDGMKAWEEYRAGTDPTQPGSVFTATLQTQPTGDHRLTWPSSLTGSLTPYHIFRTTDLLDGRSWVNIAGPISRDLSGTNEWIDVSPPSSPSVFYQIRIPGPHP